MKHLTPADIANSARASGFNYVNTSVPNGRGRTYYQAHGGRPQGGFVWRGTTRTTALEAAEDYCDAVNSGVFPHGHRNKSAGHKRPQQPRRRVPSDIQAARGMVRDWEAQQRKGAQGYVYCISDGTAVKVGFSVSPEKRVPELQTGNPRVLTLLGTFKGTEADERRLHRKFRHDNILQEWFRPTPALLSEFGIKEAKTA